MSQFIARIGRQGAIVGTGFLIDTQHVITCAHVVNQSLGRDNNAANHPADAETVDITFLFGHGDDAAFVGHVVAWRPMAKQADAWPADIAVLKLDREAPPELAPATIFATHNLVKRDVNAWGFPRGYPRGKPAEAVVTAVESGLVHLNCRPTDVLFLPGHSGAPVMLADTGAVIGMLSMTENEARDTALAIPADALYEAWPNPAFLEPWRTVNPYRGMQSLGQGDRNLLFGRDEDIASIVKAAADQPKQLLLLLGASGVGKSSLILAGVFDALKTKSLPKAASWPSELATSSSWRFLTFSPGSNPVRKLVGAFLAQWLSPQSPNFRKVESEWCEHLVGGYPIETLLAASEADLPSGSQPPHYLIYIDQGEELYTRGGRDPGYDGTETEAKQQQKLEARRFSELIGEAAHHERVTVLMSSRSDYLGKIQADKPLFDAHFQINVGPLDEQGLLQMVRLPAETFGVTIDLGLAEALVSSTREQEGGLPLLSDTLETLWREMQARTDGTLSWGDARNGVNVATKVAVRADTFLKQHPHDLAAIRRLLCVRLAHVPKQGPATRKTFFLDEADDRERALVNELSDLRILTTSFQDIGDRNPDETKPDNEQQAGRPYAQIAHETLFTAWKQLAEWIKAQPGFFTFASDVASDRVEWEKLERPSNSLLMGRPLERARAYLETNRDDLPPADVAFINASIAQALAEDTKEKRDLEERVRLADEAKKKSDENARLAREGEQLQTSRLHRTIVGFVGVALMAIVAAGIAWYAVGIADAKKKLTENTQVSQSGLLANAAENLISDPIGGDGVTAALLALEGLPDKESDDAVWRERGFDASAERVLELASRNLVEKIVFAGHSRSVRHAVWSPDGTRILTSSWDGTDRVWDARTGKELFYLQCAIPQAGAKWSPNGERIIEACNSAVVIFDAKTGKKLSQFDWKYKHDVGCVAWSPDGTRVASVSTDGTGHVWDAASGKLIAVIPSIVRRGIDESVIAAWSPTGDRVVTNFWHTAQVFNVLGTAAGHITRFEEHTAEITSAAFNLDGTRVLTASADRTAMVWEANGGRRLARLDHPDRVTAADWSPDGIRIVTASGDAKARVWSADGREITQLVGHTRRVVSAAWDNDGKRIVTTSDDATARVWSAATGKELARLTGHGGPVSIAAWSPDGTRLVTGSDDGTARGWELAFADGLVRFRGPPSRVKQAYWSPNGDQIATISSDGTICVWQAATAQQVSQLNGKFAPSSDNALAWSVDGKLIVSSSSDHEAGVWDAATGNLVVRLQGTVQDEPTEVAWPQNSDRIVITSGNVMQVWKAATGNLLDRFEVPAQGISVIPRELSVSPDGTRLAFPSRDENLVKIRNVQTGEIVKRLESPQTSSPSVWSRDGSRIVTRLMNRVLSESDDSYASVVWDVASDKQLAVFSEMGWMNVSRWSPNDKRILTETTHGIWIWDPATGKRVSRLNSVAPDSGNSPEWDPSGTRIVTAGRVVQLWDAADGKEVARLDSLLSAEVGDDWRASWSPDNTGKQVKILVIFDGKLVTWQVPKTQELLVALAKERMPRCLTLQQRRAYFLPDAPPSWCVEQRLWPYHTQEWQDWLPKRKAWLTSYFGREREPKLPAPAN